MSVLVRQGGRLSRGMLPPGEYHLASRLCFALAPANAATLVLLSSFPLQSVFCCSVGPTELDSHVSTPRRHRGDSARSVQLQDLRATVQDRLARELSIPVNSICI